MVPLYDTFALWYTVVSCDTVALWDVVLWDTIPSWDIVALWDVHKTAQFSVNVCSVHMFKLIFYVNILIYLCLHVFMGDETLVQY